MHTDFQIFRCANYCDLFPPTDLEEPRNACCFGWTFLELPPAIQKSIWKVELWASHKWPLRSRELWAWSLITVFFEDHLVTWTIGVIVWWSFCTLSEMRNDDTIFDYYVRKEKHYINSIDLPPNLMYGWDIFSKNIILEDWWFIHTCEGTQMVTFHPNSCQALIRNWTSVVRDDLS